MAREDIKAEQNSSEVESGGQQEQEKEQCRRASHMAGTKGGTKQPQGARERTPRTTGDQDDVHLPRRKEHDLPKESGQGGHESSLSRSSIHTRGNLEGTKEKGKRPDQGRPGQKEKGTVPGNQHRGEQEGKDGSDSIEEQWGEPAREGPRTPQQDHNWQHREETLRERQAEARKKPRLELNGTTRQRKGNRKPSGARIRRYTSLPQGAWSKLQREAGNPFNVLKAANTARRHTAGTQSPEKGRPGIGPVPGGQEAQGSGTRAAAGEGQERAGQNRQLEQKERRQPGELQAPIPHYKQ